MKRKVIDMLIEWNKGQMAKPVLLFGAKGVGKTYVAYDFSKAFYKHILYLNFEREPSAIQLTKAELSQEAADNIIEHFGLLNDDVTSDKILILDEITACPDIFRHLAYLNSCGVFTRIIAITSIPIPEAALSEFKCISITPLEFDEFLIATSNEWYIEAITNHFNSDKPLPDIVHKELLELHKLYIQIGGMPGSINEYLQFHSLVNVAEHQNLLMGSYHNYILRSDSEGDALKMNQVLDSLPLQLAKTNKKFQYKLIRKGTTHSMYKDAILKLMESSYVLKSIKLPAEFIDQATQLSSALLSETDMGTAFKLYMSDVGLLYSAMINEAYNPEELIVRKALLENYVAQALQAKGYNLSFWESGSMAKIDFILQQKECILPIEVHIDGNTRSKSISILKQSCDFPFAIKISSKNFEFTNQIKYVPYYAVFCI